MPRVLEWLIQEVDYRLPYVVGEKLPRWLQDVRFAAHEQARARHKAQRRANPVLMQHWVDADTPHADMLDWFDHCIALAPYREWLVSFHDQVAVFLIDAPADEQQNRVSSYTFATHDDLVLFHWQGDRYDWNVKGRAALHAAIPVHHLGLTLAINATPFVPIFEEHGITFGVQ